MYEGRFENVICGCDRPFKSSNQFNRTELHYWNEITEMGLVLPHFVRDPSVLTSSTMTPILFKRNDILTYIHFLLSLIVSSQNHLKEGWNIFQWELKKCNKLTISHVTRDKDDKKVCRYKIRNNVISLTLFVYFSGVDRTVREFLRLFEFIRRLKG